MRHELLVQTRLVSQAIDRDALRLLSGTESDLGTPPYLKLKERLARIKSTHGKCRFIYLMGQRPDGRVYFFADNEPIGSEDESPAGQIYEEISAGYLRAFETKSELVEGPVPDRWGTWVTGLVPIVDAESGHLVAMVGMDIDARQWKWDVAAGASVPLGLILVLWVVLITAVIIARSKEALRKSKGRYRELVEGTTDLITRVDLTGQITFANHASETIYGIDANACLGRPAFEFVHDEDRERTLHWFEKCLEEHTSQASFENRQVNQATGEVRDMLWTSTFHYHEGQLLGINSIGRDISDRKRAEEERLLLERQVQHTLKLESLGVLAGGIAHDFNNILTGVLGNAELAMLEIADTHPAMPNVRAISKGANQAAHLTRQMLAYSGRGKFVVEMLDLSVIVDDMNLLLRSSIPQTLTLTKDLEPSLPAIRADAAQIQQVVMNLIINASEAIGDENGTIALSTGLMACSADYLANSLTCTSGEGAAPAPGTYVYFEVRDTGCGMDESTRTRLFEPFFTTKFTGRGLGMAAVLGIMRGHYGAIVLDTEPGRGTTFRMLFPVAKGLSSKPIKPKTKRPYDESPLMEGTVLVVDDEEAVRRLAKSAFTRKGLTVLEAEDGREGLQVFREHADDIACVFMDLTMPNMNGESCSEALRKLRPDINIVIMSGYDEQGSLQHFVDGEIAGFIQKPFSMVDLGKKLEEVLLKVTNS
jgi:two-component system, cell cycle sensor histidine kinase and response regulator CckA